MVKNIAIKDSVYESLAKRKRADESFSDEITRLIGKKRSIMEFAGAWDIDEKEYQRRIDLVKEMRAESDKKMLKKIEAIK
ncbi:MAG: antitoxin VapB family protein [Nanoarchaeota archaeon]